MQRYKQPHMDVHPDGEWIRYADHCEAMKRIAGEGLTAQQRKALEVVASEYYERGYTTLPGVLWSILAAPAPSASQTAPENGIARLLWDAAKAIQWHLEPDSPDEHETLMTQLYAASSGMGAPGASPADQGGGCARMADRSRWPGWLCPLRDFQG